MSDHVQETFQVSDCSANLAMLTQVGHHSMITNSGVTSNICRGVSAVP